MKKLSKKELAIVNELTNAIVENRVQEFVVLIKSEKGTEMSITSEGSRPMIGRLYRGSKT